MFKIIYLPEAMYVLTSAWDGAEATFKSKLTAQRALDRNYIYYRPYNPPYLYFYRKSEQVSYHYKAVPKHLFDIIEV